MKSLSRGLSSLALLAWGALLLYFYLSGRLNEYLIPAYRPLVAISGAVMLLIAGSYWLGIFLGPRWQMAAGPAVEDCPEDFASPGRVRATQFLAFGLLVVPLWAAMGVSKDQFGARAVLNRGITSDAAMLPGAKPKNVPPPAAPASAVFEPPLPGDTPVADNAAASAVDASQFLRKTPSGHIIAEVTDLLYAAEDDSLRPLFENKTVELIGQSMPVQDGNVSGNRFQVVRMFMVCCAADARPVAVAIEPPKNEKLTEMAWVRVTGKVAFPMENGHFRPVVHMEGEAQPCDPPGEVMLY